MPRVPELVSVIVPAYRPGPLLREQLAAVAAQDYTRPYEVIVADNGSRDAGMRDAGAWIAGRNGDRPRMRVVDASARRGPGAARNIGVAAARGDFLAFCDADDVVSPAWLRELVATAADADLVGGRLDAARLNSPAVSAHHDLTDPAEPHLGFLPVGAGANLGMWADAFAALGGFDERSRTGEDVDLVWRAQLGGWRFRASPALVHKRLPATPRDTAARFVRYGMGDAWLYRAYRAEGMPRRSRHETIKLWRGLARGFHGLPDDRRRDVWLLVMALSCGRLLGSSRYRVLFP